MRSAKWEGVRQCDFALSPSHCALYPCVLMTVDHWLRSAVADAEARGLPELRPLLEMLARATRTLRAADWNARADGASPVRPDGR